jgi:hypothetical protein
MAWDSFLCHPAVVEYSAFAVMPASTAVFPNIRPRIPQHSVFTTANGDVKVRGVSRGGQSAYHLASSAQG